MSWMDILGRIMLAEIQMGAHEDPISSYLSKKPTGADTKGVTQRCANIVHHAAIRSKRLRRQIHISCSPIPLWVRAD